MVKAVVGANWGDEGKGKITDMLAQQADIIIRFFVPAITTGSFTGGVSGSVFTCS